MAEEEAGSGTETRVSIFQALEAGDPEQLGGYTLAARLGAGGMGTVYLSHTLAGRPVAIKAIRPELADDPDFRRRFRREVAAARRVHGLYTAPVIDSEIDNTPLWLATAFVQGPTLSAAVSRHGTLPVPSVLLLAAGVAEALQAVHGESIVHRDLKASNVLLATDGPRVIDFGIAQAADATALTDTGVSVGTPPFMSPEQASNKKIGPATDIFSLGQLITYAAKGTPAFGGGQAHGVLYRIVHEEPDLSEVPESLLPLLNRCLTKDPDQRPSPADVINLCRTASEGGMLQRAGNWLPEAVTVDITRHQDVPVPPPSRTVHLRADAEAKPAQTGSPEWQGGTPARAGAHGERTADAGASGLTSASPPLPAGHPHPGGRKESSRERLHPVAGHERQRPSADTPQPVRKSAPRRAVLALGATFLAGAVGTTAVIGLRDDSDTGNPQRGTPKKISIQNTDTLHYNLPVPCVTFPDSETLAIGDTNGTVRLRNTATNKTTTPLTGNKNPNSSIALSPDGKILATGDINGTVHLRNVATRKTTTALTGNKDTVTSVAFSPDGKTLAIGDTRGSVHVWNKETRDAGQTYFDIKGPVKAVAFSPDGKTLAIGRPNGTVRLWNSGIRDDTAVRTGHKNTVTSVAFSPDGKTLAIGDTHGSVHLWGTETPHTRTTLTSRKNTVTSVAFSPDGKTLATGSNEATVRLWKASGNIPISAVGQSKTRTLQDPTPDDS